VQLSSYFIDCYIYIMSKTETIVQNDGIPASVMAAYGASSNGEPKADSDQSALLYRNIHSIPRQVVSAKGNYLTMSNGQSILDATCGAAVSCLGHGNERVTEAIVRQLNEVAYCLSIEFGTKAAEDLAAELRDGTGGLMKKAYIVNSGKLESQTMLYS
jgi:adenosylmethionine-8-amino-7-oxononanoate aminotransferase